MSGQSGSEFGAGGSDRATKRRRSSDLKPTESTIELNYCISINVPVHSHILSTHPPIDAQQDDLVGKVVKNVPNVQMVTTALKHVLDKAPKGARRLSRIAYHCLPFHIVAGTGPCGSPCCG